MTDQDEDYEYPVYFVDCTCEHDPEQHDWVSCTVPDCPCEGHLEE